MAETMILKLTGGPRIATVTVDAGGGLRISLTGGAHASEIEALILDRASARLPLLRGKTISSDVEQGHETLATLVGSGDRRFLSALADSLTRSGVKIGGRAVRAWVSRD
jgi:hypothetical protein